MTAPIYVLPDIHGQIAMLDHALDLVRADGGAGARIVFLGDYVDRGPDSRAVLQRLIDGCAAGRDWTCLKGNHDRMFQRFATDGTRHDARIMSGKSWLDPPLGGRATLASYGVEVPDSAAPDAIWHAASAAVPAAHLDFLAGLPLYLKTPDLLCVHAGVLPGVPPEDQAEDDLLWIREPFLSDPRDHDRLVVHGHTALQTPQHHGNRVNLDGGAGYGRPLCPAVFEGRACWLLSDRGRVPLLP